MARILIIRFSALGDVAMTIPVIHSLAVQYPQHEITVLSRAVWQPLFQSLPENVNFVGADLTGKHKGLWGLNSLYFGTEKNAFRLRGGLSSRTSFEISVSAVSPCQYTGCFHL